MLLFSAGEESAWLAHVERRYAWLKKHLLAFEEARAQLFPPHWRLSERLAEHFCQVGRVGRVGRSPRRPRRRRRRHGARCSQLTREALGRLMASRRSEVDVKLLLYAIQKTYNFELLLHKRFVGESRRVRGESVPSRPNELRFAGTDVGTDAAGPRASDSQNAFDSDAKEVHANE